MLFKVVLLQILMVYGSDGKTEEHKNLTLLPSKCGQLKEDRILTSVPRLDEFPWMALIAHRSRYGIMFECTGTIINSWYILTSAQCAVNPPLGVRVGDYDLTSTLDCDAQGVCQSDIQDLKIAEEIIHQNYTSDGVDIALIRLEEQIKFNYENVAPICLPVRQQHHDSPKSDDNGVVVSWGLSNDETVIRKYDVNILPREDCQCDNYPKVTEADTKFCAGVWNPPSHNVFYPDIGGPLIIKKDHYSRYIQYGVFSERGCESIDSYTNVTKYVDWILDNITM